MRTLILAVVVGAGCGLDASAAAEDQPLRRFGDYPASLMLPERRDDAFITRLASETDAAFRRRVVAVGRQGPNFDGHYAIVRWQVGDRMNASVVETVNGESHELSFGGAYDCWHHKQELLQFRIDSSLLVVQGRLANYHPRTSWEPDPCGTYYLSWTGSAWVEVGRVLGVPQLVVEISGRMVSPERSPVEEVRLTFVRYRSWHGMQATTTYWTESGEGGRFSITLPADRYEMVEGPIQLLRRMVPRIDGERGGTIDLGDVVTRLVSFTAPDFGTGIPGLPPVSNMLESILRGSR